MRDAELDQLRLFIKQQLRRRGLTYKNAALRLGVSEVTVKRWLTNRDFSVATFFKIKKILNLSAFEIDLTRSDFTDPSTFTAYTEAQEKHFVENPKDLLFFLKLYFPMTLKQVQTYFGYSNLQTMRALSRLEKIGVLELWPQDVVRFKLKGPFRLRENGQISKILFAKVRDRLFAHFQKNFPPVTKIRDPNEISQFRAFEFYATEKTARQFSEDLRRLTAKYYQLGISESQRKEKVVPISAVIGVDQFDIWAEVLMA